MERHCISDDSYFETLKMASAEAERMPLHANILKTRKTVSVGFFLIALILLFLTFQLAQASVGGGVHSIRGAHRLADSCTGSHFNSDPDAKSGISIILDGTDEGIRSLLDRKCDLAVASRKMRSEERMEAEFRDMDIKEATIGQFAIAVAVHPSNCIDELTVDQVHKIFDGTFTSWSQVGGTDRPISIVTINTQGPRISAYISQTDRKDSLRQIRAKARDSFQEPNEVALVQIDKTIPAPRGKILRIKRNKQSQGILPTQKEMERGEYPFVQPMYLYIDWKHAEDEARAFFTFCAGQYGKAAGR